MKEFELIKSYFTDQVVIRKDVVKGIGDDCALLNPSDKKLIAVTTDTLVAGVHFPVDTPAKAIGHKSIAVNLSDLAAMGAEPSWISIAITMPEVDESWLADFSKGMFELAEYYNVQLIGGDTTQGPLSITITAQGLVPEEKALCRDGAQNGDYVFVTGDFGDAGLALAAIQGKVRLNEVDFVRAKDKLDYPKPQVLVGQLIRDYATSAIDVSDGLLADLQHICLQSSLGVNIDVDLIPMSDLLKDNLSATDAINLALTAGDDYQLIFTVSATNKVGIEMAMEHANVNFTCIGQMNTSGDVILTRGKDIFEVTKVGFEHFSNT